MQRHIIKEFNLSEEIREKIEKRGGAHLALIKLKSEDAIKRGSYGFSYTNRKKIENSYRMALVITNAVTWNEYIPKGTRVDEYWRFAIFNDNGTIMRGTLKNCTNSFEDRYNWDYETPNSTIYYCAKCGAMYSKRIKCQNSPTNKIKQTCCRCNTPLRTKKERQYGMCAECRKQYVMTRQDYHDWDENPRFSNPKSRKKMLHMGYELEMHSRLGDTNSYMYSNDEKQTSYLVRKIAEEVNKDIWEPFWHFERDGSLENHGVECISEPLTLGKHFESMGMVQNALDKAKENGGHIDSGCGLHIHIDREYYGRHNRFASLKLAYLIDSFQPELELVGGRTETSYCKSIKFNKESDVLDDYDRLCALSEHHTAINIDNWNTIEIRMYMSTFNSEILMMYLDITNALAKIAKVKSYERLPKLRFYDIAKYLKYRGTIDTMAEKRRAPQALIKKMYEIYDKAHSKKEK